MDKIILQKAGAFEWDTIGIFDDIQSIHNWLEENWCITFEEYKNCIIEEEGYEPTVEQWLEENELNVIYTKQII